MENSIKAFAYTRALTDVEERIQKQTENITRFAADNNIEILHWYGDYIEGGKARQSMLDDVTSGAIGHVSFVIADTPDRISRSAKEYFEVVALLAENNLSMKFASGTDKDILELFLLQLQSNVFEYDSRLKVQKVKAGMKREIEDGLYPFRPPLGYEASGTKNLYQPTHAANVFGEYLHKAANKEISIEALHAISKKLFGSKKSISEKKLKQIALNPFYAGVTHFDGQAYQGSHRPIVSFEDQKKLEELFA